MGSGQSLVVKNFSGLRSSTAMTVITSLRGENMDLSNDDWCFFQI